MQTPRIGSSSSAPALMSENTPPSSIVSGNGMVTTSVAPRQHEIASIELSALPNEVLALIMCQTDDVVSLVRLCVTCRQFNAIYQDVYKAYERQYHKIMYNIDTPVFRAILRSQLSTAMPDPGTAEWKALQAHPLEMERTGEARQTFLLKKAYLSSWALLLQPEVLRNCVQATALMKILLDLRPHINNARDYTVRLFDEELSWQIFGQLADVHLDHCLHLVAKHLPTGKNTFGYQFIATQLSAALEDPLDLIKKLARFDSKSVLFYTLEVGAEQARLRLLEVLVKRGCDVNQTDEYGNTTLLLLLQSLRSKSRVSAGDLAFSLAFLQTLLQHPQIDVNARDNVSQSALDIAIHSGKVAIVQALLRHPQIDVNARNRFGYSALHKAIRKGEVTILQVLLQHPQIDVNEKDMPICSNALELAIIRGKIAIIQTLLQHPQIDINARDDHGESALDIAISKGKGAILQMLLQHPKIDVNACKNQVASALHFAVQHHALRSMQTLLASNIDLPIRLSAFNYAIWIGKDEIIEVFLQGMAEQEKVAFINQALALAIKKDQREVEEFLREKYAAK